MKKSIGLYLQTQISKSPLYNKPLLFFAIVCIICFVLSFYLKMPTSVMDLLLDTFFPLLFVFELGEIAPTDASWKILCSTTDQPGTAWGAYLGFFYILYPLIAGIIETIYSFFIYDDDHELSSSKPKGIRCNLQRIKKFIIKALISIIAMRTGWILVFGTLRHAPYLVRNIIDTKWAMAVVIILVLLVELIFFHFYIIQIIRLIVGISIPTTILFFSSSCSGTNINAPLACYNSILSADYGQMLSHFTFFDYVILCVISMTLEGLFSILDEIMVRAYLGLDNKKFE